MDHPLPCNDVKYLLALSDEDFSPAIEHAVFVHITTCVLCVAREKDFDEHVRAIFGRR